MNIYKINRVKEFGMQKWCFFFGGVGVVDVKFSLINYLQNTPNRKTETHTHTHTQ